MKLHLYFKRHEVLIKMYALIEFTLNYDYNCERLGPFEETKLIGSNAVKLDLPCYLKISSVAPASHTQKVFGQSEDISLPIPIKLSPIPETQGDYPIGEKILSHGKLGRRFRFLTLMKGDPLSDAMWKPTADFVDLHGAVPGIW